MLSLKQFLIAVAQKLKSLNDNKVNKSGDTLTGNLVIDTSEGTGISNIRLASDTLAMDVRVNSSGSGMYEQFMGLLDRVTSHWIFYHEPSTLRTYHQYLYAVSNTGTFASNVAGANSKLCNVFKIGKVVFIQFVVSFNTLGTYIPQNVTICTIPEAYRPSARISLPCIMYRNSTGTNVPSVGGPMYITANGEIGQNISGVAQTIYCSAMYVQTAV